MSDNKEMKNFDYEYHYKKLISDLTNVLSDSIEMIPEQDKDTLPEKPKRKIVYGED